MQQRIYFLAFKTIIKFFALCSFFADAQTGIDSATLESQQKMSQQAILSLTNNINCYKEINSSLQKSSAQEQAIVADLLLKEEILRDTLREQDGQVKMILEDIDSKTTAFNSISDRMRSSYDTLYQLKREQQDCYDKPLVPNFICDFAMLIMGYETEVKSLTDKSDQISREIDDYKDQITDKYKKLSLLQAEAQMNNKVLRQMNAQVQETQTDLAKIIKMLADVVEYQQSVSLLNDSLLFYLEQLNSAKPEDEFDEIKIQEDLSVLSGLLSRLNSEAGVNGLLLSNGEHICAD